MVKRTVGKPFTKGAFDDLARPFADEARLEMVDKVLYHGVHMWLHRPHTGNRVVADDRALETSMLDLVDLAEHVIGDLAIDDGAAVLVEVCLLPFAVRVVDSARELGIVNVEEVGSDANNWTVLLVELLHAGSIVG
jgi:hypothetical protein